MSTDSLGETAAGEQALSSPSFSMSVGLLTAYGPPGEVLGLVLLADDQTLGWDAERNAHSYNLYRDLIGALAGASGGSCEQQDIPGTTTSDATVPPVGDGWFYLVTAENRLGEESTRGNDSAGGIRPETAPCP
jgi:hypothetical protein